MKTLVRLVASAGLAALGAGATHAAAGEPVDRQRLEKEIDGLHAQLQEKAALLLAPPAEDAEAWSAFLHQPDAGLVRLLPRDRYRGKLGMNGDGAYYSFERLTHAYGHGSDVSLEEGELSTGFAGLDLGLLVRLGDVPLERATLDHPAIRFLAALQPPPQEPAMRALQRNVNAGITQDGFTYRSRVGAAPDTTYALRSISPGRSDVLVAFRIVRRDADDSVVLAWQKLK